MPRDSEFLREQIEQAERERNRNRYERGECDLCGLDDSHLLGGLCNSCRERFRIKEVGE